MGKIIGLIFLFSFSLFTYAQTTINGQVKDSISSINSVSVMLKDSTAQNIVSYTFTNANGNYVLQTPSSGKFILVFTSLGYDTKSVPIYIEPDQPHTTVNVTLKEKSIALNEVILQSEKPITVKKDTISFKSEYFTDGTEQTVEQLLSKIPGIQIDDKGTIKVGNQEIEKLMVDGDDFFEKGYKILSKNMPAYPIEVVEILKNYSNNRLLKGIEESDKVALNLKLNEEAKRVWFGNMQGGIGNGNFYELKANLMNFGKKNKYYFFTNLNNIGYDATGDVTHLIHATNSNNPGSIGSGAQVNNLLVLAPSKLQFKKERSNFNNVELLSLNAIFNPTKKLKVKTLGFFNWDELDFYKTSVENVNTTGTSFTNTENYQLRNKKQLAFGKIDLTYDISKTKMLETTTKFNSGDFNDSSHLVFNGLPTIEALLHQNTLVDQNITYSNKVNTQKAFLVSGRYIYEKSPETYHLNRFLYEDLFPGASSANRIKQYNTNEMHYAGVNAHVLDRKKNGDLLEWQFGNEFREDRLQTVFDVLYNETLLERPSDYQNNTVYSVNDTYLKGRYRYKMKKLSFAGSLAMHQLYNRLAESGTIKEQYPFFINPNIGVEYIINSKNKLTSSYSYNTTNAGILDVYSNYVLKGYNSFAKSTGNFNQLAASTVLFNYQLGNWSDRFIANMLIMYTKNHDFFSYQTNIVQNYSQANEILIKDREFINIDTKLDYYVKQISANFKVDLSYMKSEYKNMVNNSGLRQVNAHNYSYGFELRSGFTGIFNYHAGSKWTINSIETTVKNSYTNNLSFLDLLFVFNKKFDVQLLSERYYFGNLETDKSYYFLDVNARYTLIENKLTFSLSGKNLFNTKTFKNYTVSDIGSATTEYSLLPRYIMGNLEYRF